MVVVDSRIANRIALETPNANVVPQIVDGINVHSERFGLDQLKR